MNAVKVLLNIDVPEGSNARVLVWSDVGGWGWSAMEGGGGVDVDLVNSAVSRAPYNTSS